MPIANTSRKIPNGLLIVFEGIDGSGKTTHAANLASRLKDDEFEVVLTKEPTDGTWGKLLRDSAFSGRKDAGEELELFIKDRQEHVTNKIRPSLAEGKVVIIDRYYFSTIAYQGARGLDPVEIRSLNEAFAPKPDMLFILEITVDEALNRIGIRDGQGNEFESVENLKSCKSIFDSITDDFTVRINSQTSVPEVDSQIWNKVSEKLKEVCALAPLSCDKRS
ncbi:dTMP kinase [Roseibacillus persicicus]|uniref:Thymidylate kinase n=1 Tax=Roseibacillus persicicus TaxID=454148 RepID=A0A918TPR7_9BACT|nr:dTMP kinase [Roseibacillus persicicus]GHC54459.1 hypothetical protein GCM10007100_21100 [Roseibacillus persicicus]